jgi:hypothetical protein
MAAIILSDEQIVELVKQLPVERQTEVFRFLLLRQWGAWASLSRYGIDKARWVAQERGLDWDEMTEEAREAFIDDVVNEAE